ncbi:MAG: ATP-binding protein, partial [Actinomycetota bacterium]
MVFVLDDVHWAAGPTLALLAHVIRSAEPSRALLVCTARNTAPDDGQGLGALIEELSRRGAPTRRIELTGLDVRAVGELVEAATGGPLDAGWLGFAMELHGSSAGNPLYVEAALSGMPAGPGPPSGVLSETLSTAVARRVARLPAGVGDLLRTASVTGLDFDLRVVARAAGCDERTALTALETAGLAGLVDEDGVDRFRFRHGLVRSALRDQLSDSRRVRVHLQVAEALEAVHRDRVDDHANALAYHFVEAAHMGAGPKALRYTVLAAERATRLLSHHEAADRYGQALALLRRVDEAAPSARYEILMARAEAQRKAGDLLGALETLRMAAQDAAARGVPEELARAAVRFEGTSFWLGRPGDDALELVETAEAALAREDSALRALTIASLARALDTSGRGSGAARGSEARSMAARLRDPETSFAVEVSTTRSSVSVAGADVSAARWTDIRAMAREFGDEGIHMFALAQAMWARVMLGEVTAADELFGEYSRLVPRLRQPMWQYWSDVFGALRAIIAADLDTAEELLDTAERVGEGFGWAREGLYGLAMFAIRREQGGLVDLVPAVRAAVRLGDDASVWRPGLAALYAETGHLDDATQVFESVMHDGPAAVPTDGTGELWHGLLSEVCATLGDGARAPWFLEQLRPCEGRFLVFFGSAAGLGPIDRLLGMLASTAGRLEEAEAWHRRALD